MQTSVSAQSHNQRIFSRMSITCMTSLVTFIVGILFQWCCFVIPALFVFAVYAGVLAALSTLKLAIDENVGVVLYAAWKAFSHGCEPNNHGQ